MYRSPMADPCNDFDECLSGADPEYDMDFTDVPGGRVLHWCRPCGERARALQRALVAALDERPGLAAELDREIEIAEAKSLIEAS